MRARRWLLRSTIALFHHITCWLLPVSYRQGSWDCRPKFMILACTTTRFATPGSALELPRATKRPLGSPLTEGAAHPILQRPNKIVQNGSLSGRKNQVSWHSRNQMVAKCRRNILHDDLCQEIRLSCRFIDQPIS